MPVITALIVYVTLQVKKLYHGTLGELIALILAVCSCKPLLYLERGRIVLCSIVGRWSGYDAVFQPEDGRIRPKHVVGKLLYLQI